MRGARLRSAATGLLAFGLLTAAFPPFSLDLLAFVALVPWLVHVQREGERAFWPGFLLGRGLYGAAQLHWISAMPGVGAASYAAWALIAAADVAFFLPLGWALKRTMVRARISPVLALPALVVAHDFLRMLVVGGISWHDVGYATAHRTWLVQAAAWGGVQAPSLLVLATNAALAELVAARGRGTGVRLRAAAVALALLGVLVAGALRIAAVEERLEDGPTVVALQPYVLLEDRLEARRAGVSPAELAYARRLELVRAALASAPDADLVVWPESGFFGVDQRRAPPPGDRRGWPLDLTLNTPRRGGESVAAEFAGAAGGGPGPEHLLGVNWTEDGEDGGRVERNSVVLVRPQGDLLVPADVYHKRELVLFGEYLPLRGLRGVHDRLRAFIEERAGFVPDLTAGERAVTFRLAPERGGATFGATICFEMVFPRLFREARLDGAAFLVNASNDVWYLGSNEPELVHLHAIFRAVENRATLVRAANVGVTTVIDPLGRELARLEGGGWERHPGFAAVRVPVGADAPGAFARGHVLAWTTVLAALSALVAAMVKGRAGRGLRSDA